MSYCYGDNYGASLAHETIRRNHFARSSRHRSALSAQDWIRTGTGLGVEKIRLAVPDFKAATTDTGTQNLATTFNTTLWNDLQNAGIFDMVSRSFYPTVRFPARRRKSISPIGASPPPNANMLAFGNLACAGRLSERAGLAVRHARIRSRRRCWASNIANRRPTTMRA